MYQEHFFLQNFVTLGNYFYSTQGWSKLYPDSSDFLEDINNTKGNRPEYKERLLALKHFGAYRFRDDIQMQPKMSQWFAYENN